MGGPLFFQGPPRHLLLFRTRGFRREFCRRLHHVMHFSFPCEASDPLQHSKSPEPQICPRFVPTIVFEGSSHEGWNVSNICQTLSENCRLQKHQGKFGAFFLEQTSGRKDQQKIRWILILRLFWPYRGFLKETELLKGLPRGLIGGFSWGFQNL